MASMRFPSFGEKKQSLHVYKNDCKCTCTVSLIPLIPDVTISLVAPVSTVRIWEAVSNRIPPPGDIGDSK